MSQITNSSPSLSWLNQLSFFPPLPFFLIGMRWFPKLLLVFCVSCDPLKFLHAQNSWCCFVIMVVEQRWNGSFTAVSLFEPWTFTSHWQRAALVIYSIDHCNGTGHMYGFWGALLAERSVTQSPRLQIENSTWLMSPLPFLIIFWLRFNHKSDNNSAAK